MAAQGPRKVGPIQARRCVPEAGGPLRRLQTPCQTALGILSRLNVPGGTVADVWIDWVCAPQGERSNEDDVEFTLIFTTSRKGIVSGRAGGDTRSVTTLWKEIAESI